MQEIALVALSNGLGHSQRDSLVDLIRLLENLSIKVHYQADTLFSESKIGAVMPNDALKLSTNILKIPQLIISLTYLAGILLMKQFAIWIIKQLKILHANYLVIPI